jgi:hypothetical protein
VKRFAAVCLLALALPASALAWGGVYPTGDTFGSSIHIDVSDSYSVDDTLPQTWATYLGTLVHGPELAKLNLHLATLPEVQATCGASALACYDPQSETILASPDDTLDEPPAKEIVAHEYGHHIANNRLDTPLLAEDYGTSGGPRTRTSACGAQTASFPPATRVCRTPRIRARRLRRAIACSI